LFFEAIFVDPLIVSFNSKFFVFIVRIYCFYLQDRIEIKEFREEHDGNALLTCQLTIFNVIDEDAAEYECFIRTRHIVEKSDEKHYNIRLVYY